MDADKNLLLSCTCPDYVQHKSPCKHLHLLDRMFIQLMIKWLLDPEPSMDNTEDNDVHCQQEAVEDAPDNYPSYPAPFPSLIQHLIDAEQARKREEEKQN